MTAVIRVLGVTALVEGGVWECDSDFVLKAIESWRVEDTPDLDDYDSHLARVAARALRGEVIFINVELEPDIPGTIY